MRGVRQAVHSRAHGVPLLMVRSGCAADPFLVLLRGLLLLCLGLCSGHRYKEHKPVERDGSSGTVSADAAPPRFACQARNCRCNHFFFIVAEVRCWFLCWCLLACLFVIMNS